MRNPRVSTVAFTLLWLAILTVFSFGSDYANALVIHALLAVLVSMRAGCLIYQDGGKSAAAVLTYAAALNFGAAGGTVVGATAALGQSADGTRKPSGYDLVSRCLRGTLAGLVTGITYAGLGGVGWPANPAWQLFSTFVPAAACFAVLTLTGKMAAFTPSKSQAAHRRHRADTLSPIEYFAGVLLAAGVRLLYGLFAWEPMLLVLPIVYLAKQSYLELLSGERQWSNRSIRHKMADLYLATIHSLVTAINAKDRFARHHATNVGDLAVAIAQRIGLSRLEIEGIKTAALLHDVGKLGVPEHILLKPEKLNAQEFAKVETHPGIGQKILDTVDFPWPVGAMIRSHHERWDGTGYPDRLKGEEIPLGARILCVADVYEAMTSKRPYRTSSSPQEAIRYIKQASGTHFDPAVVRAFEEVIQEKSVASLHRAADDEIHEEAALPRPPQAEEKVAAASGGGIEDISKASSEFLAMFEIAQTASVSLNLDEVLALLATKIRNMISCSTCVVFLRDEQTSRLEAKIAVGPNAQYFEGGRALIGQGLTGVVAETGEGLVAEYDRNDVMLRQLFNQWVDLRSAMIVPITYSNTVIGTINLYDTKGSAFTEEDFSLLTSVAPQVGKAIQNSLLFEETKESALTDVLTGLRNARYLFVHLERELSRAKRSLKPVSVLGLDLDNFKLVNDTFGHPQGDVVLQEIGQLFVSEVRDYDLVCRCAGDEFIIVLPETDKREALETVERIKSTVDTYVPSLPHHKPLRLGISIGVASYPEDGQDVRTLIAKADAAMYLDKRQRQEEQIPPSAA